MRKFGMLLTLVAALAITLPGCGEGTDTTDDGGTATTADAGTPDAATPAE